MVSRQLFSLNEVQRNKYSFLGNNEKHLIKPYYDQRDNEAFSILLDSSQFKEIQQQIKIKQCITSQVIFYIQVYLDLLKVITFNTSQYFLKQPFLPKFQQKVDLNKDKTMNEVLADFKIGIIGCGIIGKSILNSLIFLLGWIEPSNIHISTRRPENLSKYEDIGLNIYFDNEKLIEHCDIVIFCFPPSLDNWAIVELRDSILQRQQTQNKYLQPFIISVVSNLYIHKLQKLLLTNRIFARTHIASSNELDSELQYGRQLFQDTELIKQLLIAFEFIFKGDKIKEDEFQLENIDPYIQNTLLGKVFGSLDTEHTDLIEVASSMYNQRQTTFKTIMESILTVNDQ